MTAGTRCLGRNCARPEYICSPHIWVASELSALARFVCSFDLSFRDDEAASASVVLPSSTKSAICLQNDL